MHHVSGVVVFHVVAELHIGLAHVDELFHHIFKPRLGDTQVGGVVLHLQGAGGGGGVGYQLGAPLDGYLLDVFRFVPESGIELHVILDEAVPLLLFHFLAAAVDLLEAIPEDGHDDGKAGFY
ncbi:hypothetical protein [Proteiniphilum sp.]|uniref:hypothetical protein n=1 Tax=Proteiniphilum sp. TaxID=1926877 RepID=UPI0033349F3B